MMPEEQAEWRNLGRAQEELEGVPCWYCSGPTPATAMLEVVTSNDTIQIAVCDYHRNLVMGHRRFLLRIPQTKGCDDRPFWALLTLDQDALDEFGRLLREAHVSGDYVCIDAEGLDVRWVPRPMPLQYQDEEWYDLQAGHSVIELPAGALTNFEEQEGISDVEVVAYTGLDPLRAFGRIYLKFITASGAEWHTAEINFDSHPRIINVPSSFEEV